MNEVLKLEHIQKYYGNGENVTKAIQDISFSVQEVLVVKGDNLYLIKNFNRLGFLHVNNLTYKTSQRYIFNTFATIFIL